MENKRDEFSVKLLLILKKITDPKSKVVDNTFLEKLLSYLESELSENDCAAINSDLLEFLLNFLESWQSTCPRIHIATFFYQFIGILSRNEKIFRFFQNGNLMNSLVQVFQHESLNDPSVKISYVKLLSGIISHNYGYEWIKSSQQWKSVINFYFFNSHLYLERESFNFMRKLISKSVSDENFLKDILNEILLPISKHGNMLNVEIFSRTNVHLNLRVLEIVLKEHLFLKNTSISSSISSIFNIEELLKFLLENSENENILDAASAVYVTLLIINFQNFGKLMSEEHIPANLLEIFYIFLKRGRIENFVKLAKFCQTLWNEIRNKLNCESKTGVHFIILQLIPVLLYNKKPPDTKVFDLFIQKLFALTSDSSRKLGYFLRDVIRSKTNLKPKDWALKGVLSATGNIESLTHDEAVLIFQTLAYIITVFVPCGDFDEEFRSESCGKNLMFCVEDASLLSAVLNALCILIEKFKINWNESLESLCLLRMTCRLLQNTHFSSIVVVQTLLLVKLAILNFMSPNLALLLNNPEDSSFECLMPVLYKRMHDPNWEIRDSCIEVITTVAELAESKYPAFQQLLEEKDFCSLVFDIMEGDSESYVRASALRALSAMGKIEPLNNCLKRLNFSSKIIKLLQEESEGIVRREAALIVKQIYLSLNESDDLMHSFYQIMGYLAICDLHWEVKVNALCFWEAVIQRVITDQGMIDGSFPKVTFSKEHKKIVTLTSEEIKLRLEKALSHLSKVGCLCVLMSTLSDDCDFLVVKKSALILNDLIGILKRYEVIRPYDEISICDKMPMKRKNTTTTCCEKRKPPSIVSNEEIQTDSDLNNTNNPDAIIEEIVNEMDINLLVSVCHPKEENDVIEKRVTLQEIKPETFLMKIRDFDLEKFLVEKQKWFTNIEVDLKSLANDFIMNESEYETNVMDCY